METDYKIIQGIKCYAPALAQNHQDFPPESFENLYLAEAGSFWFQSRNSILTGLFKKHLGTGTQRKVMEIGCGTGFVLSALSRFKNFLLTGAEARIEGLELARKRLPDVELIQLDARKIPFKNEFDAVGAFDVLEHIDADVEVLKSVFQCLKPGGLFFITVPQHPWLWASPDERAFHKRRYSRKELFEKLRSCGFQIQQATSFVFILLPVFYLIRRAKRRSGKDVTDELKLPAWINWICRLLMKIDEVLILSGISLPVGASLAVVAKKQNP